MPHCSVCRFRIGNDHDIYFYNILEVQAGTDSIEIRFRSHEKPKILSCKGLPRLALIRALSHKMIGVAQYPVEMTIPNKASLEGELKFCGGGVEFFPSKSDNGKYLFSFVDVVNFSITSHDSLEPSSPSTSKKSQKFGVAVRTKRDFFVMDIGSKQDTLKAAEFLRKCIPEQLSAREEKWEDAVKEFVTFCSVNASAVILVSPHSNPSRNYLSSEKSVLISLHFTSCRGTRCPSLCAVDSRPSWSPRII